MAAELSENGNSDHARNEFKGMWFQPCPPRRCTMDKGGHRKTMSENALMKKQLSQKKSKKEESNVDDAPCPEVIPAIPSPSLGVAKQAKKKGPKRKVELTENKTEKQIEKQIENKVENQINMASPQDISTIIPNPSSEHKSNFKQGKKRKRDLQDDRIDATPEKHGLGEDDILVDVNNPNDNSDSVEESEQDPAETPVDLDMISSTNQIKKKPRRRNSILDSYKSRKVKRNKKGNSPVVNKSGPKRALIFNESPIGTPDQETSKQEVKKMSYTAGELVWGKLKGFDWWPGCVLSNHSVDLKIAEPGCVWIKWYGDNKHSMVHADSEVVPYQDFKDKYNPVKLRGIYKKAVFASLRVAATRCRKTFNKDDLAKTQGSQESDSGCEEGESDQLSEDESNILLIQWAMENFQPTGPEGFQPQPEQIFVETSKKSEQEKTDNVTDSDVKCETPKSRFNQPCNTPSLAEDVKILFDEVRSGKRDIDGLCLACGVTKITSQHPLFEGGLCKECKQTFLECAYLFDEDGYQMYCSICGDGKEVLMCDSPGCFRAYCNLCIDMLCGVGTVFKITSQKEWKCHMCTGKKQGLLKRRDDWQSQLHQLFMDDRDVDFDIVTLFPPIPPQERRPLRVLGLFDGIASGLQALKGLEMDVEVYFAAEIDKDAIQVASVNHGDGIQHVGNVLNITESKIKEWGPFDLVIGGSPCNDLSIANPIRRGIYEGTGRLFFEFFRILSYAKPQDPEERPFFWFFENVVGMRHVDKQAISRFLQCNPVVVDAKEISPAHRARYFWGNLPGMNRPASSVPGDCLTLQECLEPNTGRKARFTKIQTVTTNGHSMKQTKKQILPIEMTSHDGELSEDVLWSTEMERLFGFPSHYTDVGNMGRTNRQRLLGSAWSVPVARHLLSPLRDYFKCIRS